MLVRPGGAQPSRGGIFIWEDGVMQGESSYLEFPLSRGELMKQGLVTYLPALEPAFEAEATEAAGHPSAPEPAKRAQIVPIVSRREPARIVPAAAGARMETAGAPAVNLPDATAVPAAVRT